MSKPNINLEEAIKKAVNEGIKAGYIIRKNEVTNYHRKTEKLLYSYNDLKASVINYKEEVEELDRYGLKDKSKSIVYMPSGSRLSREEILDARIQDLYYKIQTTEREIKKIDNALETIKDDDWYGIIELKYFKNISDIDISELDEFKCDPSTIRRHKNRLINKIAIRLFGADAIQWYTNTMHKSCLYNAHLTTLY